MRPVPLAVVVRQPELVVLPLSTCARLLLVFPPALLVRVERMSFPTPTVFILVVVVVVIIITSSQERLRRLVRNVGYHPQQPLRIRLAVERRRLRNSTTPLLLRFGFRRQPAGVAAFPKTFLIGLVGLII